MSSRPTSFSLLALQLVDIGPLRGPTDISLTDTEGKPTNLYLIMGPNGAGKTSILEAIYCAMGLLNSASHPSYGFDPLDDDQGGVQLDARVVLDDGILQRPYVLSIVAGSPGLLRNWSRQELKAVEAFDQIILRYERAGPNAPVVRATSSSPDAILFADAILEQLGAAPGKLFDTASGFPTLLYFPSERGIRAPAGLQAGIMKPEGLGYRTAQRFDTDGQTWSASLDNLFVWFAWLDDGREKWCRDLINDLVFRGRKRLGSVNREHLYVPVEVDGFTHRLHQLSSGERQLVQLIVRVASHMTGATIVIIDETEQHLHSVMRRRLMNTLMDWARSHSGLGFILTSHQTETFRRLSPNQPELGLVKGGMLVRPRFKSKV